MAKKIVLADDEQFIVTAYRDGLTRNGFDVVIARDGEEAFNKIVETMPDIILLDLIMPKMNGFDVLKKVKADPKLANIPVIVLSNLSQQTDANEARNLGAVDFIVKSDLSLADLVVRVNELVGSNGKTTK